MRIILSAEVIADRVQTLAAEMSEQFRGRPLTVVGVLSGSVLFLADLMRQLTVPHQVGFLQASSYRGETTQSGTLRISHDFFPDVAGRDVLLVDDIFDTGQTLAGLLDHLSSAQPASITTCVLLSKRGTQTVPLLPDYVGFEIANEFVVGYGLDYNQNYRHLPQIAVLEAADL